MDTAWVTKTCTPARRVVVMAAAMEKGCATAAKCLGSLMMSGIKQFTEQTDSKFTVILWPKAEVSDTWVT